jgi:hypothetical protein
MMGQQSCRAPLHHRPEPKPLARNRTPEPQFPRFARGRAQRDAGPAPAARSVGATAMAMHFSGRLVQLARSAIDRIRGRRSDHGARRRHAVQQPQNFQLRFQLVGHAIDGQVRFAHRVFNAGDEGHGGQRLRDPAPPRIASRAWCRFAGITSSSSTRKPARAAPSASQRPSGPAPMMATVVTRVTRPSGLTWRPGP